LDRKDIKPELSLDERDRRWSLVRERLKREGLAAIIIYGNKQHHVPLRYLSNTAITGATQEVMLFPAEGAPIVLVSAPLAPARNKQNPFRWVENMYYSVDWAADLAKKIIEIRLEKERIGMDSFKTWPVREYRILRGLCPDIELSEASMVLSKIRGPKSREEIRLMEEAIRIAELAQRAFLSNLRPGLQEQAVVGKVEDVVRANGVDQRLWLIASDPENTSADLPGTTIIQRPNPVAFSSEFARTRGYSAQVVRTYCWDEPKGEYKRMWELWKEFRMMVPKELRPGRATHELGAKIVDMAHKWGFECDYLGHAIGLYVADDPYISSSPKMQRYQEWTIMPNEVYVFHPMITAKDRKPPLAWIADMYLVGEDGTKWMTPFLPGLPEMIPT